MDKLIEKLLGRRMMAPSDEGGGGGASNGDGAAVSGADASNDGGGAGGAGGNGGGAAKADAVSAAAIAARAGGAFAAKPAGDKKGNGAAEGDGVDPATRPKADATGERPAHIPEKFWDAKTKTAKTDDLAKAYATLESNFATLKGEKGHAKAGDTPDAYLPEGIKFADGKTPDRIHDIDAKTDPALAAFRKVAHQHKLPLDVAAAVAADFLTALSPLMEAPRTEADIIADLGEGGAALRDELGTWMAGLFDSKTFSENELEWCFSNFGKDAIGVRVLAKVRELTGQKPIPLSPGKAAGDIPSKEEWYQMQADPRMSTDIAYREKVEAFGERLFGTEPAGSSEAGVGMPPPRKVERRERASTRA